jgi:Alpha-kinase family
MLRNVSSSHLFLEVEKFNSNTGWTPAHKTPWIQIMQAPRHYSYHASNGRLLLCDLQGGVYQDGFILTDPVIMSGTREYGPTNLGQEGIATFFSRNKCNPFCSGRGWSRPQNVRAHFKAQAGKSMELHVPTRYTRAPLTRVPQRQPHQHNRTCEECKHRGV